MTNQTSLRMSLTRSQPEGCLFPWCILTFAAILVGGSASSGSAQEAPAPQTATHQTGPAKVTVLATTKPAENKDGKTMGGYQVHSTIDLGGRFAEKSGSRAMWATMINQSTGARVLGHELRMHSVDPHKTPFFDTLTSSSFGYGGDPYDASYLNLSKGKWYEFAGNFRRNRQYFDYNLLANSLLGPNQLTPEPNSLHLYNTVRRNTGTLLTILPVSLVSFRAGYSHNTHEGPAYSTIHQGGDVQESEWFRNAVDTWTAGVDFKPVKRTTFSYDELLVYYKGDTNYRLAALPFALPDKTPVTVGVDLLTTSNCGTSGTGNFAPALVNGVVNPFCSGTTTMNENAPTRTSFPTEQFRFASNYWDKVAMNGRLVYSGATSHVNSFNETFIGLNARTLNREVIDTGALPKGHLADNKRINVNADYSIRAEIGRRFEISDVVNYWNVRIPGVTAWNSFTLQGVPTQKGPPAVYGTSLLTPLTDPSLTATTTLNTDGGYLATKNAGNTILGTIAITSQVKLTGGWRFNDRQIKFSDDPTMTWHQNWMLLGGVIQPTRAVRINLNYDMMDSKSSNATTTASNTYTREAPNKIGDFRGRAQVKPAKWVNFSFAGIVYTAENNDPQVNHKEHNHDISFAAQVVPAESWNVEFDYAHNDVFSSTDLCYNETPAPSVGPGSGTCANTASGNQYLGSGLYNAPSNFFTGVINYASKRFTLSVGGRVNSVNGSAELLSPYEVPGALQSTYWTPYADVAFKIAPQWWWHGDWNHPGYSESGPAGPAPRDFSANILTLGVRHAF